MLVSFCWVILLTRLFLTKVSPLYIRFLGIYTNIILGQGTCMAIESGIALATVLRHWKTDNLEDAFKFYQDLRKPRTDRVTQTSYEAGKLASSDSPDEMDKSFNPD